jgi:hypothetical protein
VPEDLAVSQEYHGLTACDSEVCTGRAVGAAGAAGPESEPPEGSAKSRSAAWRSSEEVRTVAEPGAGTAAEAEARVAAETGQLDLAGSRPAASSEPLERFEAQAHSTQPPGAPQSGYGMYSRRGGWVERTESQAGEVAVDHGVGWHGQNLGAASSYS